VRECQICSSCFSGNALSTHSGTLVIVSLHILIDNYLISITPVAKLSTAEGNRFGGRVPLRHVPSRVAKKYLSCLLTMPLSIVQFLEHITAASVSFWRFLKLGEGLVGSASKEGVLGQL